MFMTALCSSYGYSSTLNPHKAQETAEFLDPAPATNSGPRRRGRWAQPGVPLSVRSMLDLRQLETLAPSPREPSQHSLAMPPSGPGKHGQQAPEASCASQVSQLSLCSLKISKKPQLAFYQQLGPEPGFSCACSDPVVHESPDHRLGCVVGIEVGRGRVEVEWQSLCPGLGSLDDYWY